MIEEFLEAIISKDLEKADEILEQVVVKKTKACPPGETRVGSFCKKLKDKELRQRDCRKTPGMKWDGERCVPMNSKEKRMAKLAAKKAKKTRAKKTYKTVIKNKK